TLFRATMNRLFGPSGIRLGFIRVPMGASDFSAGGYPYTYDDIPVPQSDPGLQHFSIGHDRPYIIPALREALKLNPAAQIIASPCYNGSPTVMSQLHRTNPNLQQWVTECTTQTNGTWIPSELEIASLRNWASAVDTWNLALDQNGGPVQQPNTACTGCTGLL